jgi:hypothetical protein
MADNNKKSPIKSGDIDLAKTAAENAATMQPLPNQGGDSTAVHDYGTDLANPSQPFTLLHDAASSAEAAKGKSKADKESDTSPLAGIVPDWTPAQTSGKSLQDKNEAADAASGANIPPMFSDLGGGDVSATENANTNNELASAVTPTPPSVKKGKSFMEKLMPWIQGAGVIGAGLSAAAGRPGEGNEAARTLLSAEQGVRTAKQEQQKIGISQEQADTAKSAQQESARMNQLIQVPIGLDFNGMPQYMNVPLKDAVKLGVATVNKDGKITVAQQNNASRERTNAATNKTKENVAQINTMGRTSPQERIARGAMGLPLSGPLQPAQYQAVMNTLNNNAAYPRIQGAVAFAQNRPGPVTMENGMPVIKSQYDLTHPANGQAPLAGSWNEVNRVAGQRASLGELHNNLDYVHIHADTIASHPMMMAAAMSLPESAAGQALQGAVITKQLSQDEYNEIMGARRLIENVASIKSLINVAPLNSDKRFTALIAQMPSGAELASGDPQKVRLAVEGFEKAFIPIEREYGRILENVSGAPIPQSSRPGAARSTNAAPSSVPQGQAVRQGGVIIGYSTDGGRTMTPATRGK